ncbi:MAG TPA: tail fiber domain-containing protein [Pyrinomonadaceae bacterium]|nr:tail fiber domain-containing protein [Pyrinomonadaceae bacterium]
MKSLRFFTLAAFAVLSLVCFQAVALGQAKDNLANMSGGGASVRWEVVVANSGVSLTIAAPDGRSFRKDYEGGASPEFSISDRQFEGLPDGTYTYELRLKPTLSPALKEAMKARGIDDEQDAKRNARKHPALPALVQSGSFAILNGAVVVPGGVEGQRSSAKAAEQRPSPAISFRNRVARLRNHPMAHPDDVVPDDQIVQGSECVGLDCVDGEVFGFDTVRLKENNTRLQFDDTSTSQGFPTNNWQIRANDSGSGGSSFLGFVDQGSTGNSETGTIIGRFTAGAPANSLVVASNGKVGLRTLVPVLDIHMNTSDTPAIRLEQNNTGGFAAQTWDIAGNEANFFVRDVTGGSRLPFRIRPGAPTSSIDIAASGNVGIGTASPGAKLTVSGSGTFGTSGAARFDISNSVLGNSFAQHLGDTGTWQLADGGGATKIAVVQGTNGAINFFNGTGDFIINGTGNVGIGTAAPTDLLSVNGNASKPGGGSWAVFSDERLKKINGRFNTGLNALMQLQPLRYRYLQNNALGLKSEGEHVGFAAQALLKTIPEAVTRNENGYLMVNNDPILWTMLNAIKEQQKEIEQLRAQVRKLQTTSRRHRK